MAASCCALAMFARTRWTESRSSVILSREGGEGSVWGRVWRNTTHTDPSPSSRLRMTLAHLLQAPEEGVGFLEAGQAQRLVLRPLRVDEDDRGHADDGVLLGQ